MKRVILDDICISKPYSVLALHRPKLRIPSLPIPSLTPFQLSIRGV